MTTNLINANIDCQMTCVDDCDGDCAEEEGVGALEIIICWHGIECRSILVVWLVGFWFLSVVEIARSSIGMQIFIIERLLFFGTIYSVNVLLTDFKIDT